MSKDMVAIMLDKSALKTTMICSSILLLKCFISNIAVGRARVRSGGRPPED